MNKHFIILGLSIVLISCNPTSTESSLKNDIEAINSVDAPVANIFWNELKSLQGKTFEGKLVSAPANDDFAGKKLVMHVLYSDDETILIPFNVRDDLSRTWVFKYKQGRIELKHDHRMRNGENDDITMYGGTSTNEGKPGMQVFPADQETVEMIPDAFSNIWWVTIDSTTFTYNLRRVGTDKIFTVAFDLTSEIEKPTPSWGWENFENNK
ncbi:MAG: hypothetical protein K0B15_13515 [Lentimicrobium sp.]|nr:hypothetical protein [Lentimicrobium sp.]